MKWSGWMLLGLVIGFPVAAAADEHASELPPPSADLLAPRPRSAGQPSMHPSIILRDAQGTSVLESGEPASAAKTCDGCHDVRWIQAHDGHANLLADEYERDPATVPGGNCFLCHVRSADNKVRGRIITDRRLPWIDTATLAATGLVDTDGERWQWRKERFQPDGTVAPATLGLGRPADRACGFCHGRVYEDPAPIALVRDPRQRMTELEGIIFSGQRISDSAINVANKDNLTRPWDVHKERLVSCANCHFSPNHPAYSFANRGPEHLIFDARRVAITEYLRRPDHRLAKGGSGSGAGGEDGAIRRCENCHDAAKVHRWLPHSEQHFAVLLCESCHVSRAHAPARQETDWTMLTSSREPRVVYRGVTAEGFVTGFRPVLLPHAQVQGTRKLGPNNLVTTYYWIEKTGQGSRPVARATLERAFFVDGSHRPEIVRALDRNGDGELQEGELVLDSEAKVKLARELLVASGANAPEIAGEIRPYAMHHGVAAGHFATRDCSTCHTEHSRVKATMVLASAVPFGVKPALKGDATSILPKGLAQDDRGQLVLSLKAAGLDISDHNHGRAVNAIGMFLLFSALAGAIAHALLRVRSARRRNQEKS